jgi:hypothetical protein
MFGLAAAVRLALDAGRGYEGDVVAYLAQTWKMVHYGIHSACLTFNGVPPSDNPPVLLYPFWLLGWLYQHLISPSFPPTWVSAAQVAWLQSNLKWQCAARVRL